MTFETKILAHSEVAQGTHEVTLGRPDDFAFLAGQYVQVQVPSLIKPDPKGASRLFSIVSSSYDMECLKVIFRSSGSGFKDTLLSLSPGDHVYVDQAAGSFILPLKPQKHNVFIAGGVGIAPFMSYLYQRTSDIWRYPVTLVFGNRNPENAAYLSRLQQMESEQKHFNLVCLYKRPNQEIFQKLTDKFPDAVWWVVGPPAMVSVTSAGLHAGGVYGKDILIESFEGY